MTVGLALATYYGHIQWSFPEIIDKFDVADERAERLLCSMLERQDTDPFAKKIDSACVKA